MNNPLDPAQIGFRFLASDDLPRLWQWLQNPIVREWYHDNEESLDDVVAGYGEYLEGAGDTLSFIVTYADQPIGYIQRYLTKDHREYWGHQGFPDDTAGVDVFIGDDAFRHRGFGVEIIRAFLRDHVFGDPGVNRCIIDPDPDNRIAVRAYEKAGFTFLRALEPPEHIERVNLMMLERRTFERGGA
jgi:aminoglycoside 6'-N-acetyltransferase